MSKLKLKLSKLKLKLNLSKLKLKLNLSKLKLNLSKLKLKLNYLPSVTKQSDGLFDFRSLKFVSSSTTEPGYEEF